LGQTEYIFNFILILYFQNNVMSSAKKMPMKIYEHLIHTVCLLNVSATLVAILREEHYKDHTTKTFLTNAQT